MNGYGLLIVLVLGVPLIVFLVWQALQDAIVRVESGTVGVMIVGGKPSRVLTPGTHLVWPFRKLLIQGYPLRELTYLAADDGGIEATDYADPPLTIRLGDRAHATVRYTIRFRIRPDNLPEIHDRIGPDGIKRLVRDRSRLVVTHALCDASSGVRSLFGAPRLELEANLGARITEAFNDDGFEVTLFGLNDVGLGSLDESIDATARAEAALELEQAAALVRQARIEHEAEVNEQLTAILDDDVLRYRELEFRREALQRWDGRIVVGDAATARLLDQLHATSDRPAPADTSTTASTAAEAKNAEAGTAEPTGEPPTEGELP